MSHTTYHRTYLRELEIHNFRSIKHVLLGNIPELVVLHGPNGSGKSNLLRAIQLLLKVATEIARKGGDLRETREDAWQAKQQEADEQFELSQDDFHRGATPEIQIRADIQVGDRGLKLLAIEGLTPFTIHLRLIIERNSDTTFRLWFPTAETSNGISLHKDQSRGKITQKARQLQNLSGSLDLELKDIQDRMSRLQQGLSVGLFESPEENQRQLEELKKSNDACLQRIEETDKELKAILSLVQRAPLLAERIRRELLRHFWQANHAERRIEREPLTNGGKAGFQKALAIAMLSEREEESQVIHRLGKALGRVKLFGATTPDEVYLRPVQSPTLNEYRVMLKPTGQGEIPVRNLGSGEQQVVMMLAEQVLATAPVLMMEEPEAHLHKNLMEPLADYLRASVQVEDSKPETDQLWIATHHHYFAIADEYLDVSLVEGKTQVERRKRSEAPPRHFYEPGPFWDALKELLGNGLQEEDVLFTDKTGRAITAGELRKAIQSESLRDEESYRLAREFVTFANETLVMSLHPTEGTEGHHGLRADLPGGRREHAEHRTLCPGLCEPVLPSQRHPHATPPLRERGPGGEPRERPGHRSQRPREPEDHLARPRLGRRTAIRHPVPGSPGLRLRMQHAGRGRSGVALVLRASGDPGRSETLRRSLRGRTDG